MTNYKPTRKSKQAKEKAKLIVEILSKTYPDSKCSLDYTNAYELLVATVLSAQTTDERVNQVTPELFKNYPSPKVLSQAQISDVERILKPIGFYRTKAERIIKLGSQLVEKYNGEVPDRLEELVTLSGVGRKTANVVLGNAYNIPGLTIDTHIGRISRRLGWTKHKDPVKAESDLAGLLDPLIWTVTCHRLIDHGRNICTARKAHCEICPLSELCASAFDLKKIEKAKL
ncbi:endonuclease III [Actinomyces sp. zg-332]|uniref:endonuclease III n=1 Tax=Actinomyces sp. zg-332 TaxID=2708340 RepID=UPI00141EDDDA|nr:endonuclease III [Actinomyces sp. zg-332]QPK94192.1 endonuclease III [Actinomyces sp. zg-332]